MYFIGRVTDWNKLEVGGERTKERKERKDQRDGVSGCVQGVGNGNRRWWFVRRVDGWDGLKEMWVWGRTTEEEGCRRCWRLADGFLRAMDEELACSK